MYEENIRQLEARKRELEASSATSRTSVPLHLQQAYTLQSTQAGVAPAEEPSLDIVKRLYVHHIY